MRTHAPIAATLFALAAIAGCATTTVTDREPYQGRRLPRPDRILVYNFAAATADLPEWSAARERVAAPSQPPTAEQLAAGRDLGGLVAERLVEDIQEMGLPAFRAGGQRTPQLNDIALVGYFTSIEEGSTLKRVVIGFGTGAAALKTEVEGYRMTDSGMHRLGSAEVESGGNKMPGVVVPIIVTVATANPIGLIVQSAVKAQGELSGRTTIEGTAKRTADTIAEELRKTFEKQGWIK